MRLLAVIPARRGSRGLPGKNIRPFSGLPLVAHSILFAKMCPEITRCIVSTDSSEIGELARRFGADVPFLRPAELAQDGSSLWPVLKHALAEVEREEGATYDALLLLDPTSPAREPADVTGALGRLQATPEAQGVIGVSQPDFTPVSHCVIERGGWMAPLVEGGDRYERRQEEPSVYRINGSLYLWRASFVRRHQGSWRAERRYVIYEIPEARAMSIDTLEQFERAELLVKHGRIVLPWLSEHLVR